MTTETIPKAFVWRRTHSLAGIWLSIYLIFHLLTNSQAALFIGDDGKGFIESVNSIHKLPYLQVIEIALLALPILIHALWGIKYIRTASYNSFGSNLTKPYLPEYPRNHAYTWQRFTAWFLLIAIVAHIVHMRFIEAPISAPKGTGRDYMVKVTADQGLYTVAARLGVMLYTPQAIKTESEKHVSMLNSVSNDSVEAGRVQVQKEHQEKEWIQALSKYSLKPNEVIAVAKDFGTADLLMLRETFKMPVMLVLYTLFVLAACFHGFNGLWTFMIKWGVTLSPRAQWMMRHFSTGLMLIVAFLGLAAIWGTYWINLYE